MTTKQIAYLKSLANSKKPVLQIGKDGINENMIKTILLHLEKNELMKISLLNNSSIDLEEAKSVFMDNDITVVQIVGHVLVLYKASKKAHDPIVLPN